MKFSIITINYNNVKGLEKTLHSNVELRTPIDVEKEIIVIDGGSVDGSMGVLKKYSNDINHWISERDNGIYHAMNKGVAKASGDFVIFMNSGDFFASHDVLMNIFQNRIEDITSADVISGGTFYINPFTKEEKYRDSPKRISMAFFYDSTLSHQASFIKRKYLLKYPYDENLKIVSDLKFWIQLLILDGKNYMHVPTPVAKYDLSGVMSRRPGAESEERQKVFSDLKLSKILLDYDLILKKRKQETIKMHLLRHLAREAFKKSFFE